jgi:20S proteasome alpha/beta subunit
MNSSTVAPVKMSRYTLPQPKGPKAMTIAVGFHCKDGIVFAADRQFTKAGAFKYHAKKFVTFNHGFVELALVFAGKPGIFEEMQQKVFARLEQIDDLTTELVRETIENVLVSMGWKERYLDGNLYLLVAVNALFESSKMLVFDGASLRQAESGVCVVGCGDTSLVRYLEDHLYSPEMPIREGEALAAYLIKKATQYVDYCGEPIDVITSDASGVHEVAASDIAASIQKMESQEPYLATLLVQTPFS